MVWSCNKWNKINIILGRELKGARVVEIKISEGDSEGNNKPKKEDLTIENYETVKRTIEKRLENLRAQDYTISLNKENGTIRIELLEDDSTNKRQRFESRTYKWYNDKKSKIYIY